MTKIPPIAAGTLIAAMALAQSVGAQPGRQGVHVVRAGPSQVVRPFERSHHRPHSGSRFQHGGVFFGWPYDWGYEPAADAEAAPADAYPPPDRPASPPIAAAPPVCPALWHWDAKHGRAIRENLCD